MQHNELLYFIITDINGIISNVSEAFKTLEGGIIAKDIQQFVHQDDIQIFNNALHYVYENNKTSAVDIRLNFNQSAYKWYEVTFYFNHSNSITISFYSIDKRKQEFIQLTEALSREQYLSQMKSKFISTTSHEIRTPLSIIKSSAEVMIMFLDSIKDEKLAVQLKNYLVTINNESDRLSHLINDVLIMQKAETDLIECNFITTDLVQLIQHTIERHNLIQKDGRIMNLEIIGTPQKVLIDPSLFEYILDNLFSNAFKYSENTINPLCAITFQTNSFSIAVKDYGMGIPENDLQNIFDLFFRADNAKTIRGTGLGLNIVKKLVEMHRGTIQASSILNNETEFVIKFDK